jgi:hypothetical protein
MVNLAVSHSLAEHIPRAGNSHIGNMRGWSGAWPKQRPLYATAVPPNRVVLENIQMMQAGAIKKKVESYSCYKYKVF